MAACRPDTEAPGIPELYIFIWEDYFAPDTVGNFAAEFGVKVTVETFGSEEELLTGLQSRPGHYDIAIASESMVRTLRQLKLLSTLNREHLTNFTNIGERFRGLPFDPDNGYSVPYLWGTTGLAVNINYLPPDVNSWQVLWEPAYRGKLAMLNDPQEVTGVALLTLGYSLNSRDPLLLDSATQKLEEQKPLLVGYLDPIAIIEGLASGKLWAAQAYSGDALKATEGNPAVRYVIPSEGAALWVDNLVIPAGAPHRETAERFINYILRPQVGGNIVNYLYYATPNQAAEPYIRKEILDDQAIYPPNEILSHLEYYQPLDEETTRRLNRIWSELLKQQ